MERNILDLNRTFAEYDDSEKTEKDHDSQWYWDHSSYKTTHLDWDSLLQHRFVMVLGEAGTGKTTEFQEQAKKLLKAGKHAFFIPIETLVHNNLPIEIENRFNQWKTLSDEGVFLLDSVDESRLGDRHAFNRALDQFIRLLGIAKQRARLVLSCRISDWQAITDRAIVEEKLQLLAPTPTDDQKPPKLKLVRLRELDAEQIKKLAKAFKVKNGQDFLTALENNGFMSFAARPRDLEWLTHHWNQHHQFASLTKMIELNITHKLEERNNSHQHKDTPVDHDKLRSGAETLAAASFFCNSLFFRLDDPAIQPVLPPNTLMPQDALPSWQALEIKTLLNRALFDPVTSGRVKFHDPTVRDYLAACWIAKAKSPGLPLPNVRSLFFGTFGSETVAIPSKRMVLGWLAMMIPEIRRELIPVAPDVLLYCGDAAQIEVEERGQALRSLATKLRQIDRTDWQVYGDDRRRIANKDLAPVILELLPNHLDNLEITTLLFSLIALGTIQECAQAALDIALDATKEDWMRGSAGWAAMHAGSEQQQQEFKSHVFSCKSLSNQLIADWVRELFPRWINVDECLQLAARAVDPGEIARDHISSAFTYNIIPSCQPKDLPKLLNGLLALTDYQPKRSRSRETSKQHYWTLQPLLATFCRVLNENHYPVDDLVKAYTIFISAKNDIDNYLNIAKLKQQLNQSVTIRSPIFWHQTRKMLARNPTTPNPWDSNLDELNISLQDLPWLMEDITHLDNEQEVALVIWCVKNIWKREDRSDDIAVTIRDLLEKNNVNNKIREDIENTLQAHPQEKTAELRKYRRQDEPLQLENKKRTLEAEIDSIRAGTNVNALNILQHKMDDQNSSQWARKNWQSLIPVFGNQLAEATREGLIRFWKSWQPELPYERGRNTIVECGVIVGLSGLAIAAKEGLEFATLSTEEATIAAHYALREMNGFPQWFEALFDAHRDCVTPVLFRQLEQEMTAAANAPNPGSILSRVSYGPESIRNQCASPILKLLVNKVPELPEVLRFALSVALHSEADDRKHLADLAKKQVDHYAATDDNNSLLLWLKTWLWTAADSAIAYVEQICQEHKEQAPMAFDIAAVLGDSSWGNHWPVEKADFLQPRLLKRLILVIYKHFPSDERIQEGGYTPDATDAAQRTKRGLLILLANQTTPEAQKLLRELAQEIILESNRPWINKLVEEQAGKAIEYRSWTLEEFIDFNKHHEAPPKTSSELFHIALDRLQDIQHDIEKGDFSDRDLFQTNEKEYHLQRWLAGRLERESRSRYSVVREEEVDYRKKTDIRLHCAPNCLVTIEIKPTNVGRLTFNESCEALETQLVGQYMQSAKSRHGILVLCQLEKRNWNPGVGGKINFIGLISRLNALARTIQEQQNHVEGLQVVGIDFTNP